MELEADLKTFTYRLLTASTVLDVGRAINPEGIRASVSGGMAMGISMASREAYSYGKDGVLQTPNLRTYKLLHIGQEPEYRVQFIETPVEDSPYGVRPYSEHGIIGIPAAFGNALLAAYGRECSTLPLTPEALWRMSKEDK
ncbi:putative xanthine dehydrogenase molybdenum-binding subunit XdhA [bioreactor metagenome]|uniref:Putative xanthine dehydrogenase molybdenum-binding subunit XdhA n=1 Tax=bioreactor metagenome TaxID=1076179 RepID=A0A644YTQ8_9ZZZZ